MFSIIDFKEGGNDSFKVLYDRYYAKLALYAKKIMGPAGDYMIETPEDIVTDCMIRLFKYRNRVSDYYHIVRLLYHMVKLHVVTKRRLRIAAIRRERFYSGMQEVSFEHIIRSVEQREAVEEIRKYVHLLPDLYRQPVELQYTKDLSDEEIAEILGIEKNVVIFRKSCGLRMLKDYMIVKQDVTLLREIQRLISLNYTASDISRKCGISEKGVTYFKLFFPKATYDYSTDLGKKMFKEAANNLKGDRKIICKLYLEGLTTKTIANQLSMDVSYVKRARSTITDEFIKFIDFSKEPNPLYWQINNRKQKEEAIKRMKAQKMKAIDIAKVLNISKSAVDSMYHNIKHRASA